MSISLIDVEAVMPKKVVLNDYFGEEEARQKNRMFSGTIERRHMEREEMASDYFAQAAQNIFSRLNLDPQSDVDMILTNVSIPDESFTGCGAVVNKKFKVRQNGFLTCTIRDVFHFCICWMLQKHILKLVKPKVL